MPKDALSDPEETTEGLPAKIAKSRNTRSAHRRLFSTGDPPIDGVRISSSFDGRKDRKSSLFVTQVNFLFCFASLRNLFGPAWQLACAGSKHKFSILDASIGALTALLSHLCHTVSHCRAVRQERSSGMKVSLVGLVQRGGIRPGSNRSPASLHCLQSIRFRECRKVWKGSDRGAFLGHHARTTAQVRDDLDEFSEYGAPIDQAARQKGMDEYQELKDMLLRRTWKFGALFSVYLFLVLPSTNASVMELLGCGAGYAYLWLLMRHVDGYNEDSETPMFEAERIDASLLRNVAKVTVGYRYSLNPRLLIPVGLVLGCFFYNSLHDSGSQLGLVEEGCMIGGFLGYKVALITKVYDDLKPKVLTAEELMREKRPDLVEIDGDVDDSLLWDTKKKNGSE